MDEWMDELAAALGEEPLEAREVGAILKLARDVAHGVERKLAPLSTFAAGVLVGRRIAEGVPRAEALTEALSAARSLIPSASGPPPG